MKDFLELVLHPAFAGVAGVVALAAAVFLVDRGRIRWAVASGCVSAALIAVVAVGAWRQHNAPPVASALVPGQPGCGDAVVRVPELQLRVEPKDGAKLLFTLHQGDRVSIVCGNGDQAGPGVKWTRVRYQMWEGWVAERVEVAQGVQIRLERLPPTTLRAVR